MLQAKAYIIASLCHDIDHRGFTNNFTTLTNHVLAQLYDESQLENHHIYVTMLLLAVLNDYCFVFLSLFIDFLFFQRHKIFPTMPESVYKQFCSEIREAILASNLAFHFKYRAKLIQLYMDNSFEWNKPEHRFLLKAMMITIADLSGYCKPFSVAKKITQGLYGS